MCKDKIIWQKKVGKK